MLTIAVLFGYFIGVIFGSILTLVLCKKHFDKYIENLPTQAELEKLRQSLGGHG